MKVGACIPNDGSTFFTGYYDCVPEDVLYQDPYKAWNPQDECVQISMQCEGTSESVLPVSSCCDDPALAASEPEGACFDAPDHCSDGQFADGETGIDCGTVCGNVCEFYCATGFHAEERTSADGFTITACYADDTNESQTTPKLPFDVCPDGYYPSLTDPTLCVAFDLATVAAPDWGQTVDTPDPNPNPANETTATQTTDISSSSETDLDGNVTDTTTTTTTNVNADGTQDIVTNVTEITTNVDGSTTTVTTITNSHLNGDGSVSGDTTTTTSGTDTNGDPTGETTTVESFESESGAGSIAGNLGKVGALGSASVNFQPLYTALSTADTRFPISLVTTFSGVLDTWEETPSPPDWSLEFPNPWGASWAFNINLAPMSPLAGIIRQLLSCFIVVCFFYLVYKRWV